MDHNPPGSEKIAAIPKEAMMWWKKKCKCSNKKLKREVDNLTESLAKEAVNLRYLIARNELYLKAVIKTLALKNTPVFDENSFNCVVSDALKTMSFEQIQENMAAQLINEGKIKEREDGTRYFAIPKYGESQET